MAELRPGDFRLELVGDGPDVLVRLSEYAPAVEGNALRKHIAQALWHRESFWMDPVPPGARKSLGQRMKEAGDETTEPAGEHMAYRAQVALGLVEAPPEPKAPTRNLSFDAAVLRQIPSWIDHKIADSLKVGSPPGITLRQFCSNLADRLEEEAGQRVEPRPDVLTTRSS